MFKKLLFLSLVTTPLLSCQSGSVIVQPSLFISETAAAQALEPGAHSISLLAANKLKPGHIYNVRAGQFKEVCENDLKFQKNLKDITTKESYTTNDQIEDKLRLTQARISALGQSVGATYDKIKVKGFTSYAPSKGSSDYVLDNVKRGPQSCFDTVLPRNKPYLVVDSIAVGKEVETYQKNGIAIDASVFGIGGTYKPQEETKTGTRTNVIFGATGKLVK